MRVSAFPRWNNSVVESRKNAIDYLTLDQFRQEVLTQEELYENSVRPFVKRCLQGCSGSIITYGSRGSGKSYTLGTLDPQQLSPCTEAAGVLPRCTQQLYESLGQGASVEITCVEVQGDDVVDLLDQRAGDTTLGRFAAADAPTGAGSSVLGSPSHGGVPAAQGSFARSPIAAAASGAMSGPRRKPLTLVVARSLEEALLALTRAVSNRQAFVTASRHSSSRTHAVFQLRWRNPAGPVHGVCAAAAAVVRAAPQALGGGVAQRAYSAPPRASLPTVPADCSAVAAVGSQLPIGWGVGPVCTLTLVDTCNFCPLLPPKEGSAVKRSLLALSRVLTALQRRQPLSLRESKLTRMLEGAVDQVLVLACLGGSGDEPTAQLVKMLHQGVSRDGALRLSRRASSSDSTRVSAAWDADPHASVCTVSSAKQAGAAGGVSRVLPRAPNAAATKCSPVGKGTGSLLGPGRAIFYSPPTRGYGVRCGARPVVASRPECPHHNGHSVRDATAGTSGLGVNGGESGNASNGDGTGTDAEAAAAQPLSSSSLDVSSSSLAASGRGVGNGGEAAALLPVTALPSITKAAKPAPLTIDASEDAAEGLVSPGGGGTGAYVSSDGGGDGKRWPLSSGGGAAGARRAGSSIPSPPGLAAGVQLQRRLSPGLDSLKQKRPSVTARTPPGPEVRRSQGFFVRTGKWASPPPVTPRDTSFPVIPCILMRHEGASEASSHRSSPAPPPAAASTDSAGPLAPLERPPRASPAAKPGSRAASAPSAWAAGSASPGAERKRGGRDAAATPPRTGSSIRNGGFTSPFVGASPEPVRRAGVIATSTVDSPEQTGTSPTGSPASACCTPARKRSGIPVRPPIRSPQPSTHQPFAATGGASPAPRPSHRPSVRSPSPAPAGAVVSLAAVRPTRLASSRYGSAGVSHDSFPDGAAVATSTVSIAALMADLPAGAPTASLAPTSLHRQRPVAAAAVGALVGVLSKEGSIVAASRRSISTGMRWPSPLLRARRAEWLTDMRRSRSALPRPVSEMPDAEGADGASPRRLRGAFRCAALGHPTLSAQYKDLLHDFEAFKARERMPRQHRSAFGGAAPTPSQPGGNLSPDHRAHAGATASPAASEYLALASAQKSGAMSPGLSRVPSPRQQGAAATVMVAAPPGSPAVSTGAPVPSSPASISTPHSAVPAPGSCSRLAGIFSRAHSPVADDGLLSLTAAAAAAAASPRTPVSGSTMPSGRPRPGVSRAAGTTASPRPLPSLENTTTQVSPVTVLDMSRLFAAGGSRTPATGTPPPLSGRSRISAGSVCAAAAALALASGGSERYRRWVNEDLDSDCISEVAAADDQDAIHGQGGVWPDPCGGTDSDQENLLGPGRLGHLGLMLDIGGDVTALRSSISRLGDSGRASPSVAAAFAGATTAANPSPLRYAAAAATTKVKLNASPSEVSPDGPDEELPAVSFFIHQFMSRAEVADKDGAAPGQQRPPVTAGGSRCAAALAAAATAAGEKVAPGAPGGAPGAAHCQVLDGGTSKYSMQEAAKHVGASTDAPPPHQEAEAEPEPAQQLQRRRFPVIQEMVGIRGGVAETAGRELRCRYIIQDRASVESGVLRGSCTPFALDHSAGGQSPPAASTLSDGVARGWEQEREPESRTQAPHVVACRVARVARDRAEGGALGLPSESSISLRQLLEKQEQLLMQQQRKGRRTAGLTAVPVPAGKAQGLGQERSGTIGVPSATLALAQLAHVRPNHFDLDEQSNVLVDVDSASESDVATGPTRRTYVSALRGGRAGSSALPAAVTSPSRPGAPLPEPPSVIGTPSPMKPSQSPSQLRSQGSAVRARIAALEAAINLVAAGSPAPGDPGSPLTPPRLVHPWAHGGGGDGIHHSPAAAALAAASTAAAAAAPQGGADDRARQGSLQARSSPSPSAAVAEGTMADTGRRAVSGSGPAPQYRAVPRGGDPGHVRHPSDGAIGAGAGGSPALRQRCLGSTAMAAGGAASPPRSPLPPPPPPPVPAQVTSSVDSDGAAHRPAPVPPPLPPLTQQQQQLHHQPQAPPQQPLPLRGSGNVAAAWRAAAAMSTSSSSSVRSCFRSSSGQQQQQHQQNMIGSDATAVATVVALNRTSGSCYDDKQQLHPALAQISGQAVATGTATATVRLSGGAERLHSVWGSSENSTVTIAAAANGGGITAAAAATIVAAAAPQLPPNPPAALNNLTLRYMPAGPAPQPPPQPPQPPQQPPQPPQQPPLLPQQQPPQPPQPLSQPPQPLPHVLPLVLPAQQPTPAIDSCSALPQVPLPVKAKSARCERYFPFTARLRACASHRTPRTPAPAAAANSGRAAVSALGEVAEQTPEAPPPPAYPPGFITWATKLFSGGKKNKQPS